MGVMDRLPLDPSVLAEAWQRTSWPMPRIVDVTGSTNADVGELARAGAPEGTSVTTDLQTAGRGRLDRRWEAPERSSVMASVLLQPRGIAPEHWGWIPLMTGVVIASAIREVAGIHVRLKWPNDIVVLHADVPHKLGGVLVERLSSDAAVVGFGINVDLQPDELPIPEATSIEGEGATIGREALLAEVLTRLQTTYDLWRAAGGDAVRCGLHASYAGLSATLGHSVEARLPGDRVVSGLATGVDPGGHLEITAADGRVSVLSSGDIVHLRA